MHNAALRTASARALETRPLTETFGREVVGLDLSKPLDEGTIDALRDLWKRHHVLLFRGQSLTEEQQSIFTEHFGELEIAPEGKFSSTKNRAILRVANVDEAGKKLAVDDPAQKYFATLSSYWHTDGSYRDIPSLGSVLHSLEVPDEGGNTCFADMIAAYEALSPEMKRRLEGKHMVHSYSLSRFFEPALPPISNEDLRKYAPVTHPVVRTQKDGRKSLYLSGNVCLAVGGMPMEEGETLLKDLLDHVTQPRFVYEHKWRVGDVLMWDNRPTMHRVLPYDHTKRRVLQRTELKGTEIAE